MFNRNRNRFVVSALAISIALAISACSKSAEEIAASRVAANLQKEGVSFQTL
jgi:hypothetical protein